ncbi:MAG: TolC family protein [Planctomycetes bacterium]|nr:TolC family protein [Planctomycetota bacterium]
MSLRSLWLASAALFGGCTSTDPAAERDAVQNDLRARLQTEVWLPASTDLEPELAAACREWLADDLTETEAVRIAFANHRGLRATCERLGIARAEFVQAGLLRNPVLDADPAVVVGRQGEIEFGLVQPLVDLFVRPLRTRLAAQQLERTAAEVTRELVHVAFAVRRAFVHLRAAQQLVELERRRQATADAGLELMLVLHQAGNATDQQVAEERVRAGRVRLDLATAEQAAREAREPLQAWLGLWGEATGWTVRGELPIEPFAALAEAPQLEVESTAVDRSLELRAQRAQLHALAEQARLADVQGFLRTLDLGMAAQRDPGESWQFGPKFTVELPLFDRGQARAALAGAELRAALHQYAQLAIEVRAAARLAEQRLLHTARRLAYWRDHQLPARAESLFRTEQLYHAMQRGAFPVLQERLQQLDDYRTLLDELRTAHLAQLDCDELRAGSRPSTELRPYWPTDRRDPP